MENNFSPTKLIKDVLLTHNNALVTEQPKKRILLASTYDYQTLLAADVDSTDDQQTTTSAVATNTTVAACEAKNISVEDLYKNLKEPPGSALNEDVGRYIGYGWKEFNNPWW